MNVCFPLLLVLEVAAVPASGTQAANAVLIVKGAAPLLVRSYQIDGPVVRITSLEGEPFILRSDQVDVQASGDATERHRAEPPPLPPEPPAASRLARNDRPKSIVEISREALARGSHGTLTVPRVADQAEPRALGQYDLEAGESRSLTIPTDEPLTVAFQTALSDADIERCQNSCVRLSDAARTQSVSAAREGGITLTPLEGHVEILIENVERFPISVTLLRD